MELQINGLHALVTGASKGIGLACAQLLLQEGVRVSGVSRSTSPLAEALNFHGIQADLGAASGGLGALDEAEHVYGPVDILINCAGAAERTPYPELDVAAYQAAMQAKYFTYLHILDPVVKRMAARGVGAVVNIVGIGGKWANPTHLAGGAANAALMLAGSGLAAAYAAQGVRVNTINPGQVRTERLLRRHDAEVRLAQQEGRLPPQAPGSHLPLGRAAEPQEIAAMAVFLASPRASYVTGAVVNMDGAAHPCVV